MRQFTLSLCAAVFMAIGQPGLFAQNLVPWTFTVNSTGDGPDVALGDGVCADNNGNCTLRAAIEEANFNAGFHDVILFQIPGNGVQTIRPASPLPLLTDNAGVTIDGSSQPNAFFGSNPPATANLLIELKGSLPMPIPAHGLYIVSDNNIIQGLIINEFSGDGIRIEGTVGSTDNNLVYGNFIGTDRTGLIDLGNATGSTIGTWFAGVSIIVPPCDAMPVFAQNNLVRHNLISGNGANPSVNRGEGVSITNCPPGDNAYNIVEFNYIGTDVNGALAIGNDSDGVTIAEAAHDNTINGNLISGNGYSGVGINGLAVPPRLTVNNIVANNTIGMDISVSTPIPNNYQGVSIGMYGPNTWGFAPGNSVINNIIAHNLRNGVLVAEAPAPAATTNGDMNLISQNSIFNNGQLGIDLVSVPGLVGNVTPNDPLPDGDNGPNQELNFPTITGAVIGAGSTTITGLVTSPNPLTLLVEVFAAAPDVSGYGEGMTYLGNAIPDGNGLWSLVTTNTVRTSDVLTATTTDLYGNTSEFSGNFSQITTGVPDLTIEPNFHVFPNPSRGPLVLIIDALPIGRSATLELLDARGAFINSYPLYFGSHPNRLEFNLFRLPDGVYWLRIRIDNGQILATKRLLLIH
ncbi:MAG: CSLREA domain-containing protein [Lewinella sp.]|nr:CSLREA domain-containing protein [Lewinella sp.]